MLRFVAPLVLAVVVVLAGVADGATRAVQPGSDINPQMSPDGRWLLFERLYGGSRYSPPDTSLRIARADGTAERELISRTPWPTITALWTPGNLVQVTVSEGETSLRRPEDGSVVRRLPFEPRAWSPDGRWIAYVDGVRDLYVSGPDGSQARLLARVGELGVVGVGSFSPDSTRLSYAVYPSPGLDRSEVVGIDGAGRRTLKVAPLAAPGIWSPDGRALVLMAQGDPARPNRYEPPRAHVVGADGSNPHPVAPGFSAGPDWSPLRDWIVYLRQTPTPMRDIYDLMIVRPDGTGRRRVVETGGAGATWLADGRRLLSVGRGACRRSGILRIDAFERTVTRLTNRCSLVGTPDADILRGTPLRDLIEGRGGDDVIMGGDGDDRLSGGPGADSIRSRDRYHDHVRCGPGVDRVVADRRDRVDRDCERVRRN